MTGPYAPPPVYCPRCGQANHPTARWCVRCGFRPSAAPPHPGPQQPPVVPPPQGPPIRQAPPPVQSPPRQAPSPRQQAQQQEGSGPVASPASTVLRQAPPPQSGRDVPAADRAPEPAARLLPDGLRAAGLRRRWAAAAIDALIVAVLVCLPFHMVYRRDVSWLPSWILVAGVVAAAALLVGRGRYGYGLGGRLLGVRTVSAVPAAAGAAPAAPGALQPVGVAAMLRREALVLVTAVIGAPLWSVLLDGAGLRRGWQDRISGTVVVDARRTVTPVPGDAAKQDPGEGECSGIAVSTHAEAVTGAPARPRRTNLSVLPGGVDMLPVLDEPGRTPAYVPDRASRVTSGTAVPGVVAPAERVPGPVDAPPTVMVERAPAEPAPSPRQAQAPEDTGTGTWALVFDSGVRLEIDGVVLVGRDPAAPHGGHADSLFAVEDASRSLSKTHLRLIADGGAMTVEDLHSTNGTSVEAAGVPTGLRPGVPLRVYPGQTVRIGARTMRIERR